MRWQTTHACLCKAFAVPHVAASSMSSAMHSRGGSTLIVYVVGARPNFVEIAPVIAELRRQLPDPRHSLIHTRQHYDRLMPEIFLEELGVPTPVHMLDVGSASHAGQTTRVIKRIEQVPIEERPDPVIVPGDVSSAGHAVRTTRATKRIEPVLEAERPALVTLPGALSPHTLEPIPNIRRTLASTPSR